MRSGPPFTVPRCFLVFFRMEILAVVLGFVFILNGEAGAAMQASFRMEMANLDFSSVSALDFFLYNTKLSAILRL